MIAIFLNNLHCHNNAVFFLWLFINPLQSGAAFVYTFPLPSGAAFVCSYTRALGGCK